MITTALVAAVAVGLGALAQSVTGIGFALLCAPVLIEVLGRPEAVRVTVLLSTVLNIAILSRHLRDVRIWNALLLAVPTVLAMPVLAALLANVQGKPLEVSAGVAIVAAAIVLATGLRWERASGKLGATVAGVASAAMITVAGISGPPSILYAANARWPTAAFRSTLQAYFLVLNLVAMATLGLPTWGSGVVPTAFLGLIAGALTGGVMVSRVNEQWVRWCVLALAASGGTAIAIHAAF